MKDNFGREIEYMRISVTDLCNLRCKYCMPEEGVTKKSHIDIISFEEILQLVDAGVQLGVKKLRLTGGEPLVRRGVVSLVGMIKEKHPNIEVAMTTNGSLLEKYAHDLKNAGLDRVNISLDTLDAEKYTEITRCGDIHAVKKGIETAKNAGLIPIKLNTVLIKGFNDDEICDLVNITMNDDIEVRFIELMPFGETLHEYSDNKYLSNDVVLKRVPGLKKTESETSKVCTNYQLDGAKGKVGLISPSSHKFCDRCNRIRITSDAKIKPCLHSNQEIDIRSLKEKGHDYEDILSFAVLEKPQMHRLDEGKYIKRNMNRIGG